MSEIYLNYPNLNDSVKQSKKARDEIDDYIEEIKKKITSPISKLPGSDSSGYASSASSLAQNKISALGSRQEELSAYESMLNRLISTAKDKDKAASDEIGSMADAVIGKRTWIQNAQDFIYNTFCVDIVNKWDWTRNLADASKYVVKKVENGIDKVKDWFKYGDGRYVLNIVGAVGTVVASVAATCAAIVAIPFTGGTSAAIAIGCIGAAAAALSTVITVVNADTAIRANSKAISMSGDLRDDKDGNLGAARYYGNISTLSGKWEKTDMGDAEANQAYKVLGKGIDSAQVVLDTVAFTCTTANSLGAKRDFRFTKQVDKQIKSYGDFSVKNIQHNLRGLSGHYLTKEGVKNPQMRKAFITDLINDAKYFKKQGTEVYNIWSSDRVTANNLPNYDDPAGEFKNIYEDVVKIRKQMSKLDKQGAVLQGG